MGLTAGDLRDLLDALPDDVPVRLAYSPHRPVAAPVSSAVVVDVEHSGRVLYLGAQLDGEGYLVAEIAGLLW